MSYENCNPIHKVIKVVPMSKKTNRKRKTPQKRPAAKRRNPTAVPCWDELHGLYANSVDLMASIYPITEALRDRAAVARCRSQSELLRDAQILARDQEEYRARLSSIYATHKDRHGGTDDPNELMQALHIGEQYSHWMSSFEAVVLPTVRSLRDNLLGRPAAGDEDIEDAVIVESEESKNE